MIVECGNRAAQFRQVLPSCEQIVRFGIGIEESIAFHSAVIMRADMDRIPMGLAAYRIMRDVKDYNKFGEMKKKLADMEYRRAKKSDNGVSQITIPGCNRKSDTRRV
jgi:hypothetical protein